LIRDQLHVAADNAPAEQLEGRAGLRLHVGGVGGEGGIIGLRWLLKSADLANKLKGGGADLLVGGRPLWHAEAFDASAHDLTFYATSKRHGANGMIW
jgi:hypothetical protein